MQAIATIIPPAVKTISRPELTPSIKNAIILPKDATNNAKISLISSVLNLICSFTRSDSGSGNWYSYYGIRIK
jgi:hypothetical protein